MANLERVYNVPLRKGAMKAPRYKRANKAVRVLREFLQRHMKSRDIKLGPFLNSKILEHGRKNIPHHVKVKAVKDDSGIVRAELLSAENQDFLMYKKEEKKEDEIKLKIPGIGKKKEQLSSEKKHSEEISEKDKKDILEKPDEKKSDKIPKIKMKSKEEAVMIKEEQVYGRLGSKKTKIKEKKK